jgi:GNAT superfamily N-acetyltransferase
MDFNLESVKEGITDEQILKLIEYSKSDPVIQKFTSDLRRFPDKESFKSWSSDAKIYTLVLENNTLAGFIWFRKKSIPVEFDSDLVDSLEYGVTVAVRLYKDARGKGLLKPFLETAIQNFKATDDYKESSSKGIWLLTSEENTQAQAAFERFGFKKIKTELGKVLMVLE